MSVVLLRYVQGIVKVLESGGGAIKKNCTCPSELVPHKTVKGDRGITLFHSEKVFHLTKVLIPVSSRKYALL